MPVPVDRDRLQRIHARELARFTARTRCSRAQLDRLQRTLPLGVASSFQAHAPYPLVFDSAAGAQATDADGNTYLDLHGGFGANVFGHAHPLIVAAVAEQAVRGAHYAHPTARLADYAEHLAGRFKLDRLRLCNSGTEATMDAIRVARAFTGRDKVVRMEGSYHGHHDTVLISMKPLLSAVGDLPRPGVWHNSHGIPSGVAQDIIPLAFNDADTLTDVLHEQAVACVIIEPILCNLGLLMPADGYLQAVRDACTATGTVLIWDEVKTGATVAWGGAGELFPHCRPDLLCLGKAVGGGLPVGVFGGRRDIMDVITDGRSPGYGTFNGNPMTVTAGLTALTEILTPDAYQFLESCNRTLLASMEAMITEHDLPCHARALGAKGGLFFSAVPPRHYREYVRGTDHDLARVAWLHLANQGVLLAPGSDEQWTLPVVISETQIELLTGAMSAFCADLRS